jgi:selenocysteine lyase/cysteine desulfurase
MNDDVSITALLHKYGALAFWDYAAAAPYVKIDMNPKVLIFGTSSCNPRNLETFFPI